MEIMPVKREQLDQRSSLVLSYVDFSVFLHETSVDSGVCFGWWSFLIASMFDDVFFFIGASFDSISPSLSFLLLSEVYKATLVF